MDFASTLRVLGKHKLIVGIMLALTIVATLVAVAAASKTQEAAGSYLLLNARTPPKEPDGTQISTNNPFAEMELSTVVDVLVRAEMTEAVADQLKSQGFNGSYTVIGNKDFVRGPVLDLTVTASDSQAATDGYELLAANVQQTLQEKQLDAGANPDYLVTMQRLQDPVISTPGLVGRLRLAIAVFGVGILLTLAVTFSVESLRNRSARKKLAGDGPEDAGTDAEASDDADPVTASSGGNGSTKGTATARKRG
jgi:hypothetical protein